MKFSVAMSVYKNDNPVYFDRALKSITDEQTLLPDEIVMVVDGPVPQEIEDVIFKYVSKYSIFKIIRFKQNQGLGIALKYAINYSSNNIIARMDSDDVAVKNRFEQQIKFFKNKEVDIVGGDITEFIDVETNIVGKRCVPQKNEDICEYMKKRCAMNHVSVMYKKESVQKAGGYLDWFWNEDYYLWIRMFLKGAKFANTGTVLVNVRVGNEMYKRRGGLRYFKSEEGLQRFMYKKHMISFKRYIINTSERFILQVLMPNNIRGWVFRTFARE